MARVPIHQQQQSLAPGALVTLFEVDLSSIRADAPILKFTAENVPSGVIEYGNTEEAQTSLTQYAGGEYPAIPCMAEGFEYSGVGTVPTPTIRVANIQNTFTNFVHEYGDLLGAKVRRIRTFARYLDNGEDPDYTAHFPIDLFSVERLVSRSKVFLEWELRSGIDQSGKLIPARQIVKDTCSHTYRRHASASLAARRSEERRAELTSATLTDQTEAERTIVLAKNWRDRSVGILSDFIINLPVKATLYSSSDTSRTKHLTGNLNLGDLITPPNPQIPSEKYPDGIPLLRILTGTPIGHLPTTAYEGSDINETGIQGITWQFIWNPNTGGLASLPQIDGNDWNYLAIVLDTDLAPTSMQEAVILQGEFDYRGVTCPYAGDRYYNADGVRVADPRADTCGKSLSDCRLRFGNHGILPTRAFPGVSRNRV